MAEINWQGTEIYFQKGSGTRIMTHMISVIILPNDNTYWWANGIVKISDQLVYGRI
jgi:hypothetical protein